MPVTRGVDDWKQAEQPVARLAHHRGYRVHHPGYLDIKRGVENWTQPGVPRGKMMPSKKFTSKTSLALPSAVFRHTISGEYPEETGDFRYDPHDGDLKLMPDLSTLSVVPWESDPTAQVICDMVGARQGHRLHAAQRAEEAWSRPTTERAGSRWSRRKSSSTWWRATPIRTTSCSRRGPLRPADRRRAGLFDRRRQRVRRADRRHLPFLRGKQGLEIDTLIHEEGPSQLEINLGTAIRWSLPTRCS
jgi:glutamine synthetase